MLNRVQKFFGRMLGYERQQQRDHAYMQSLQSAFTKLKATYDAARTSDEFKNIWANTDALDADSANSRDIRHRLMWRSRYEIANNAYADGIAQTITNDLIGVGPALRMLTGSAGFNQMVELSWNLWTKAIGFRSKLWCMGHAKHGDGEAFGVLQRNPRVNHPIKLDVRLYEAEMCQTPFTLFAEPNRIDGIRFDDFGNPSQYEFLNYHPGSTTSYIAQYDDSRLFPANLVLHWYRMRRPGQHRGVPEMVSSLNTGAAARRWREANLTAAERAAVMTLMMKTQMTPEEADLVAPFSTMDIFNGMMSFLPAGWEMQQADGKFPTANYEMFHKQLINEMGRSVNMPRNKAACDSSDYNYASGRLDHGTYYDSLDIGRADCDAMVLDKAFDTWFDLAIARFGWLGGDPEAVGPAARLHLWDWPKHRVADVEAEASANQTKLKSGQTTLSRLYSDQGEDFEDEVEQMARDYGLSTSDMRARLRDAILPVQQQASADQPTPAMNDAVQSMLRRMAQRGELAHLIPNGNGAHHG
jgi:capsid protein